MESLVRRLKEELRGSQDEGNQAKQHLRETGEVILNLQGQISSLKHKLVLSDGAARNIENSELQDYVKEVAGVRA